MPMCPKGYCYSWLPFHKFDASRLRLENDQLVWFRDITSSQTDHWESKPVFQTIRYWTIPRMGIKSNIRTQPAIIAVKQILFPQLPVDFHFQKYILYIFIWSFLFFFLFFSLCIKWDTVPLTLTWNNSLSSHFQHTYHMCSHERHFPLTDIYPTCVNTVQQSAHNSLSLSPALSFSLFLYYILACSALILNFSERNKKPKKKK